VNRGNQLDGRSSPGIDDKLEITVGVVATNLTTLLYAVVLLQFFAIVVIMATIWAMGR